MRTKFGQDARKAKEEIQNAISNLKEDSQKELDELKDKLEGTDRNIDLKFVSDLFVCSSEKVLGRKA